MNKLIQRLQQDIEAVKGQVNPMRGWESTPESHFPAGPCRAGQSWLASRAEERQAQTALVRRKRALLYKLPTKERGQTLRVRWPAVREAA